METRHTRFSTGQQVALRVDPARVGVVIEAIDHGSFSRYRVFHGPGIGEYDADQLVAVEADRSDAFDNALATGSFVSPEEFRARLTAARLSHPAVDELYAMQAARILHVPFQYKPLLRILRADRPGC